MALAAVLVAVIVGATLIYNGYMENNGGGLVSVETPSRTEPADEENNAPPADPNDQKEDPSGDQNEDQSGDQKEDQTDGGGENKVEMTTPDFTVLDYEGNEVKLSDYVGKPIVLNFWATWCVYCKMEMPDFDKAYKEYPDVLFLMVNATDGQYETVDTAKKYVEDEGYSFTVLFDTKGEAERAYNVTGWPTTFFINAKGELVAYASGALPFETLQQGIGMITE